MLSNLPSLKIQLSMTDAGQDALLTQLLGPADATVKRYCKRDFEQTTYPGAGPNGPGDSGYYSGTGKPDLILRQRPVTAIAGVWLDAGGYYGQAPGAFDPTSTALVQGVDYVLVADGAGAGTSASGILKRIAGGSGGDYGWWPPQNRLGGSLAGRRAPYWPWGDGNVKVQYTAGWPLDQIPADLAEAVLNLAVWFWRTRKLGGQQLQQEHLGQYAYQVMQTALGALPELGTIRQALSVYREISA